MAKGEKSQTWNLGSRGRDDSEGIQRRGARFAPSLFPSWESPWNSETHYRRRTLQAEVQLVHCCFNSRRSLLLGCLAWGRVGVLLCLALQFVHWCALNNTFEATTRVRRRLIVLVRVQK